MTKLFWLEEHWQQYTTHISDIQEWTGPMNSPGGLWTEKYSLRFDVKLETWFQDHSFCQETIFWEKFFVGRDVCFLRRSLMQSDCRGTIRVNIRHTSFLTTVFTDLLATEEIALKSAVYRWELGILFLFTELSAQRQIKRFTRIVHFTIHWTEMHSIWLKVSSTDWLKESSHDEILASSNTDS